jgi:membrane-bound ClpP family serine protease
MILIIILLFMFGLIAILLEALLPYGISAAVGFILMGISAWLAYQEAGPSLGTLYLFISFSVSAILLRVITRYGLRAMTLRPPKPLTDPASETRDDEQPTIGSFATVIQPLRPTGAIEWKGRRYAARSLVPETETPVGARVILRRRDSTFWVVEENGEADSEAGSPADQ